MSKSDSFDRHMLPQRNDLISAGAHVPPVRTNAYPLETFTDPASLRTEHRYDWKTGTVKAVQGSILESARRSMCKLSFRSETAERTHPHDHDNCYVGPCMAAPTPSINKKPKKKGR